MNPAADGMPMIPLDQGLGIIGIGVVKGTRAVEAASKEAIVIGETAKRVAKYANKIGVKYYVPRKEIKAIGITRVRL